MGVAALDRANRADSATDLGVAESGQAWTQHRGTWGINGGAIYQPSNLTNSLASVECNDATADVSATVAAVTTGTGYQGLAIRVVDTNNYLCIQQGTPGNDNNLYIVSVSGGAASILATTANTIAAGDRLRLVAVGTTISAFVNGVAKGSVTSSLFQTATRHGLWSHASASAGRFDNFVVLCPTQAKMVTY